MASVIPYINNLQQQTESEVSTVPFASVPEIYGDNTFVLDKNTNIPLVAEKLALEAKQLIIVLKTTRPSNIQEQFQIELRKLNFHDNQCLTYQMSLRIDPLLWFKYHTLNSGDVQSLEQLYEISYRYVEKVKSETEHYPQLRTENEIERISFNSPKTEWCYIEQKGKTCDLKNKPQCHNYNHYEWCMDENDGTKGVCQTGPAFSFHRPNYYHFSQFKENNEAVYQCRHSSTNLNRKRAPCLFRVDPHSRIYENELTKWSSYPYFIVAARPDATPVITLNPVRHCLNEEYLQTSDAWQAVLLTLIEMKKKLEMDQLPLNRIYVNFGKWMQQKADDPARRSCHAHINIVLTRETIDKINDRNQSKGKKTLFPSLVGSVLPPNTHRLDDSLTLIAYMNDHMTPVVIKQNKALMRRISVLDAEVEELKKQHEYLMQSVYGRTHTAQEAEDAVQGTDAADGETGINDGLLMQEFSSAPPLE